MFLNIKNLCEMEEKEQWEEIRKMLLDNWRKDKDNVDKAIRLGTECWYALDGWTESKEIDWDVFRNTLIEVTNYGIEKYKNNALFLAIFGYMISIFPDLFYKESKEGLYKSWQKKGKEMREKAYEIEPNNQFVKVMFLASKDDIELYKKAKEEIVPSLLSLLPGNSCIEEYFRYILGDNSI